MIEVLKQMYQLLLTEPHAPAVCDQLEVILRKAIAELESQEPVAWMHTKIDGVAVPHRPADLDKHPERWEALYKTPPPCPTCEALARTVMLDQTSHDTHPPQRTEPVEYWNVTEGWATVGQEGASDQVYRFPKWPHKYQWVTGRGYVVWRDVFEGNMKCSLDEAITAHTQAVFVFEDDASNYCNFKNTHPPKEGT
jgi:hypothetical protein